MATTSRTSGKARASLCRGFMSSLLVMPAAVTRSYTLVLLIALLAAGAIVLGVLGKRQTRASQGLLRWMVLAIGGVLLGGFLMPSY
jgi:hypothetical protein